MRVHGLVVGLLAIGCLAGCRSGSTAVKLSNLVPREAAGWRAEGDDRLYDRQSIFQYIDGAGEVYLQYAYRSLLVREFAKEGAPGISVQLFDMTNPEEAFGIFSFEREDEEAGVGTDSEYAAGLLRFWKGRFFVCVSAEEEKPGVKEAVFGLAQGIARAIAEPGARPALVAALPTEGLRQGSVRYFHGPFCLAYHYPLPGGNLLALGADTDAVLASYAAGAEGEGAGDGVAGSAGAAASAGAKERLILVRYPDEGRMQAALAAFSKGYEPPLDAEGVVRRADGRWAGARGAGRMLAAVFEAPSRDESARLLAAMTRRLEDPSWRN